MFTLFTIDAAQFTVIPKLAIEVYINVLCTELFT